MPSLRGDRHGLAGGTATGKSAQSSPACASSRVASSSAGAADQPGDQRLAAERGDCARDVDALAAGVGEDLADLVHGADLEVVDHVGAIDRDVGGDGEDHASAPCARGVALSTCVCERDATAPRSDASAPKRARDDLGAGYGTALLGQLADALEDRPSRRARSRRRARRTLGFRTVAEVDDHHRDPGPELVDELAGLWVWLRSARAVSATDAGRPRRRVGGQRRRRRSTPRTDRRRRPPCAPRGARGTACSRPRRRRRWRRSGSWPPQTMPAEMPGAEVQVDRVADVLQRAPGHLSLRGHVHVVADRRREVGEGFGRRLAGCGASSSPGRWWRARRGCRRCSPWSRRRSPRPGRPRELASACTRWASSSARASTDSAPSRRVGRRGGEPGHLSVGRPDPGGELGRADVECQNCSAGGHGGRYLSPARTTERVMCGGWSGLMPRRSTRPSAKRWMRTSSASGSPSPRIRRAPVARI